MNLRQPHKVNVNFFGSLFIILYRICFIFCKCFGFVYFPICLCQCFVLIAVFTAALICEIKCFQKYLGNLVSSFMHTKSFGAMAFTVINYLDWMLSLLFPNMLTSFLTKHKFMNNPSWMENWIYAFNNNNYKIIIFLKEWSIFMK